MQNAIQGRGLKAGGYVSSLQLVLQCKLAVTRMQTGEGTASVRQCFFPAVVVKMQTSCNTECNRREGTARGRQRFFPAAGVTMQTWCNTECNRGEEAASMTQCFFPAGVRQCFFPAAGVTMQTSSSTEWVHSEPLQFLIFHLLLIHINDQGYCVHCGLEWGWHFRSVFNCSKKWDRYNCYCNT